MDTQTIAAIRDTTARAVRLTIHDDAYASGYQHAMFDVLHGLGLLDAQPGDTCALVLARALDALAQPAPSTHGTCAKCGARTFSLGLWPTPPVYCSDACR